MATTAPSALTLWRRWGQAWAMFTGCRECELSKMCRGRRRDKMLCLECFDTGESQLAKDARKAVGA